MLQLWTRSRLHKQPSAQEQKPSYESSNRLSHGKRSWPTLNEAPQQFKLSDLSLHVPLHGEKGRPPLLKVCMAVSCDGTHGTLQSFRLVSITRSVSWREGSRFARGDALDIPVRIDSAQAKQW